MSPSCRPFSFQPPACSARAAIAAGLALAGLVWSTTAVLAEIVTIEYRDKNIVGGFPEDGGPLWVGRVDTVANTLTIDTWNELPGTPLFWKPLLSEFPMVWQAVKIADPLLLDLTIAAPYDVPDTFNGEIDSTWAFISTRSARTIAWDQGSWAPDFPTSDFYPGWGGVRRPIPGGGGALFYDLAADETQMPLLPVGVNANFASDGATISVLSGPNVSPVPEAAAVFFGALSTAIALSATAVRRAAHLRRQRSATSI